MMLDIAGILSRAREIDEDEFLTIYTDAWNKMYSFKKLEPLQEYNVGEESYEHFQTKQYSEFVRDLIEFWKSEKDDFVDAVSRSAQIQRLRIVSSPVSEYIEHEYYSYIVSERMGEEIRFLRDETNNLDNLLDFILFDRNTIIINLFNNDSSFASSYVYKSEDCPLLSNLYSEFEECFSKAVNYKEILENPNQDIISEIVSQLD